MKKITIASEDIGELLFGQLHVLHQSFFDAHNSSHNRIKLREMPHYIHLRDGSTGTNSIYYKYLKQSWKYYQPEQNTHEKRVEKINKFSTLAKDIQRNGVKEPIIVAKSVVGDKMVIIDGNHRASIAYHLGLDVPAHELTTKESLENAVVNNAEFYGTQNKDMPYQSIYAGGSLVVPGRRADIHERFMKIDIKDIRGKTVADTGSNIAISGMLAWHYGAKAVTGFEFSPQIATTALRISTFLDAEITLKVQDMGEKIRPKKQKFDTVFCFSLHAHVKNKTQLARNLADMTGTVLYFEGHENSKKQDYQEVFQYFSKVKMIGYNRDGIHSKKSTRPFFKCVK